MRHESGKKRHPFPLLYLLLLLLRDQVGVAVHSLLCLVLVPAALLIQTLGLGQTPNTACGEALGESSA